MPAKTRALFACVVIFVIIASLEITLRALSLDLYQENQFFPQNRDINFVEVYDKDHNLFWRLKGNVETDSQEFGALTYRTNSLGFRETEIPPKSKKVRVIALGNSCTFGWGVLRSKTYVSQLRQLMPGIEAFNCGVPGYSSHQGLILLKREILALEPDILLIMFGWNDHWPAGKGIPDNEQSMPPQWILTTQNLLANSRLFQAIRKVSLSLLESNSDRPRLDQRSGLRRVGPVDFKNNLARMIQIAAENDVSVALIVPPIPSLKNYFSGKTISAFHDLHERYQNAVIEVAAETGVPLVNLQIPFDRRSDLYDDAYADGIHFNAAGHRVAAQEISQLLDSIMKMTH
ncbi:MAG: hypothetical protein IIB00_11475 [candidate division Zixibacteria bacterium]|nr:hypothetical protein [candidate division Zixibacteria bacterium]